MSLINNNTRQAVLILLASVSAVSAQPNSNVGLIEYLSGRLVQINDKGSPIKRSISQLCNIENSAFERRVFAEYGAMFVAADNVRTPPVCVFKDEAAVSSFRTRLETQFITVRGADIVLQKAAAESLYRVLEEATNGQIMLVPLDGSVAGGRTYDDTVKLWNSRFQPALEFWVKRGTISPEEEADVRSMALDEQVAKVIDWESKGLWFGTNRNASIFSSTAPPGTSQHLALLALDIPPPITPEKRALMNSNGWFQTVKGDVSHFTYLGVAESSLPGRGLRAVLMNGTIYWVPNIIDPLRVVNQAD